MFTMFYTYILQSNKNNKYYVGSCENINKRLMMHNKGLVKSTKNGIPWKVLFTEEFSDRSSAFKREKQIKSWKKRSAIEKLINK